MTLLSVILYSQVLYSQVYLTNISNEIKWISQITLHSVRGSCRRYFPPYLHKYIFCHVFFAWVVTWVITWLTQKYVTTKKMWQPYLTTIRDNNIWPPTICDSNTFFFFYIFFRHVHSFKSCHIWWSYITRE